MLLKLISAVPFIGVCLTGLLMTSIEANMMMTMGKAKVGCLLVLMLFTRLSYGVKSQLDLIKPLRQLQLAVHLQS